MEEGGEMESIVEQTFPKWGGEFVRLRTRYRFFFVCMGEQWQMLVHRKAIRVFQRTADGKLTREIVAPANF